MSRGLEKVVADEAMLWGDAVADNYHAIAASHMDPQWRDMIVPALAGIDIDMSQCADFACGRGRNTVKLLKEGAGHVTMIDVNPQNIDYVRAHVCVPGKATAVLTNGLDLAPLEDGLFTFLYTFDAMVHFDVEIVFAYIREFHRVMRPGAVALMHHSNFDGRPGSDFRDNPHLRNYMTAALFRHVATRRGFDVLRQNVFSWGELTDGDCITVMRKV